MKELLRVASAIDSVSRFFAIVAAWLVLLCCLISAGNAVSRYAFNLSSNAWLEIQWQMFAGMFLLATAHVLKLNEHVRVDLFYGNSSERRKLWIDVFGLILFLFPAALLMVAFGWPFFMSSFLTNEQSSNAGGLPVWPVKLLLPLGFSLLILQGVAELIKRIAALRGLLPGAPGYERPLQ